MIAAELKCLIFPFFTEKWTEPSLVGVERASSSTRSSLIFD
jgi:hypothetical protein